MEWPIQTAAAPGAFRSIVRCSGQSELAQEQFTVGCSPSSGTRREFQLHGAALSPGENRSMRAEALQYALAAGDSRMIARAAPGKKTASGPLEIYSGKLTHVLPVVTPDPRFVVAAA